MIKRTHLMLITSAIALLAQGLWAHPQHTADKSSATQQTNVQTSAQEDSVSQNDILKASEAFGHFLGRNLKAPGLPFDLDSIIKGMRSGYAGNPSPITDQEYEKLMSKIQEQTMKKLSNENLKAANDFLERNALEKTVLEIVPGKLQYTVIQEGTGEVVKEHDSPQIKYSGKLLDGTSFGNSDETGGSITIPLDQTIPGFSKGIAGMKEGEKRKLFIHPELGYGTSGHLPPNALLIFEVEILKANAPKNDSLGQLNEFSEDEDFDDLDDDTDDDDNQS